MVSFLVEVKMVSFLRVQKRFDKGMSPDTKRKEKSNGTYFSRIAPSSGEL